MRGLPILLRKELLESWRTYRLPIVVGLFAFVGLSSPLVAKLLPEIIKAAGGEGLGVIAIPTPTAADAVLQVQKNLGQFGALAAILLAMGAVATELERGTAAFVLVHPVGRSTFLAAKAIAIGLVLALSVTVAIALGWFYTTILFAPPDVLGWVALGVLSWLALGAWAALTFLASVVTGSSIAAAGLGFVALITVSILAAVPAFDRWTPSGLSEPASALAIGASNAAELGIDLWVPVASTIVLIAVCIGLAVVSLRRREL